MGGLALITHNADRLYMPNLLQPQEAKLCTREYVPFSRNSELNHLSMRVGTSGSCYRESSLQPQMIKTGFISNEVIQVAQQGVQYSIRVQTAVLSLVEQPVC